MEIVKVYPYTVSVPADLWARCEQHASGCLPTVAARYSWQGSYSEAKILRGIAQGKGAEVAAYLALSGTIESLSAPDFRVYDQSAKTFDPDLSGTCKRCGERLSLHIKCWDALARDKQGKPYPESYTFSLSDPVCITKNLSRNTGEARCRSPHEVAIFLARTGEAMGRRPMGIAHTYEVRWFVRGEAIPGLLEEPCLARHRETKRCVYGSTLLKRRFECVKRIHKSIASGKAI